MMWLLIAILVVCLFYYLFVKPLNYWKERGVKGGNPIPMLGDNWKAFLRIQSFSELIQDIYKLGPGERYCGIFQTGRPTLVLKDPELIKQITVKDFDYFTDRGSVIDPEADPLSGKNLLGLKGQAWKDMRGLLSPCFTSSKMKYMFVLMQDTAKSFVENFKENQEGVDINMKDVFTRYTNDIIASVAFGIEVDSIRNPNNDFYSMGKSVTDFISFSNNVKLLGFIFFPGLMKHLKISLFSKEASKFFRVLVDGALDLRGKNGIVRPDMINLFLEARKGAENKTTLNNELSDPDTYIVHKKVAPDDLSNEDITAQALVFFFAGFDTVSSLLCFACYELVVNPDVQTRLREEIIETSENSNGKITYETLHKMKYLDMVISESLRKWPVTVLADRICTKPYTIEPVTPNERAIELKAGDVVWLPIMGIHRDPAIYPDTEKFDPERFSDENKDQINPYTYIPFGVGPRSCIGNRFALLEAKVVLYHILRDFEIVPTDKTRIPIKISRKQLNMFPEGGFHMGLKRIK